MERSYSANVRVTPVLNVPVCSLRCSSKSGGMFGFPMFSASSSSSQQKRERSGSSTIMDKTYSQSFVIFPKILQNAARRWCCHTCIFTTCPPLASSINESTLPLQKNQFPSQMANLSIITFSLVILASSFVTNGIPGGRTKVTDVETSKELQQLGKYSVEEYNRFQRISSGKNDGDLRFSRVVEAEKQVVSGMKYYLKIEAFSRTSEEPEVFEAVVVVKPWRRSKQLQSFAPSSVISQRIQTEM